MSNEPEIVEHVLSQVRNVAEVGMSREESQAAYAKWAALYDKDNVNIAVTSPRLTAENLAKLIPHTDRPTTKILDIGAGTGLAAIELRKQGFQKIDALEPCPEMLEIAKNKQLYDNYFLEAVTDKPLNIPEKTYDALTGSGIFAEGGHVTPEACDEMIRLVKSDGYIVLTTRQALVEECVTYRDKLEPYMTMLEGQGRWKRLVRDTSHICYADRTAIVFVYQVL